MKSKTSVLTVFLFSFAAWVDAADTTGLALPEQVMPALEPLLATAAQQSPRMVNQAIELEIAENNRIAARSAILPNFSANISYLKSDDKQDFLYKTNSSAVASYQVTKTPYGVTLSQPVFHWGERRNQVRIGEIQYAMAQGQYREAYRLLAQEVRASYLRLILSKFSVERARFYAKVVTTQVTEAEARWKAKAVSDAELAALRLTSERASLSAEQAEVDFENSKAYLARISGSPVLKDTEIPDRIGPVSHNDSVLNAKLAFFLAQSELPTAEALNLRNQIQVEKLNVANAKTRLRPKVNAVLGYSQDQQSNLYGTIDSYKTTSTYAGVSLYWTIFDGFASKAAVKNSLARQRQLENDYRQMREKSGSAAQNALKQLYFISRTMAINDRLESESRVALEATQADRVRGTKSEADINQGKLNVLAAEYVAMNVRMDYLLRLGDFLGMLNQDPVVSHLP